jgi:hypothetical protein
MARTARDVLECRCRIAPDDRRDAGDDAGAGQGRGAFTHRSYGRLPWEEYESWIDLTITVLGEHAGAAWDAETEAAWVRHGERLKELIIAAREGWDRVMPGHVLGVVSK